DAVEKSGNAQVQARWEKLKAQWAASGDELAPFRGALSGGNSWRGSNVFYGHPVLACIRCHQINGEGGAAGPDLSVIGREKSPEYLLESVVRPNAKIAAGFDFVTFQLKNGEVESGSVVSESATRIVVKRADGTEATIDPKQVQARQSAPSSMPQIYDQVLTRSELRDLMAYLKSLTEAEPALGETVRAMSAVATADKGGSGHK